MNAVKNASSLRRWVLPALAILGISLPLSAQTPAGRIRLKSGEEIVGDVLREVGEIYFILGTGGLKILPKASVASIAAGPAQGSGQRPSLREAEASRPGVASTTGNPAGKGSPQPPAAPSKSQPDKSLDLARTTGQSPSIEIAVAGKILQRPLPPSDAFTVARLAHFLSQVSRPRFEVLPTGGPAAPGTGSGGKKAAAGTGKTPEYRAEIVAEGYLEDVQFFGLPLQKVPRAKVLFRLEKLSDKKVIEELEVVGEEPGGNPEAPEKVEELCRSAYNRAVLTLLQRLGQLNTFGGPASADVKSASEKNGKPTGDGKKA